MNHIIFEKNTTYNIALLIKTTAFIQNELETYYVDPLVKLGLEKKDIIAWDLEYNANNKATVAVQKAYLSKLLNSMVNLGVSILYVCDANYFKTLTGERKAEPHYGYVLDCTMKGYTHFKVVYGTNYGSLLYSDANQGKLDLSLSTLTQATKGAVLPLGYNIIHSEAYPSTSELIKKELDKLHQYPALTVDIEAFSLMFNKAGIGTISFAWDQHNGIAFACDFHRHTSQNSHGINLYGEYYIDINTRKLIKEFFESYQGTLIYHNANYDIKVLIYTLWMNNPLDQQGLLKGLEVMTRNIEDTKVIAYLATNNTGGNKLKLKELAHSFAGNWAEDVTDIRSLQLEKLLTYNLVDCLSTWYTYNTYKPILIADQQEEVYNTIMLPSIKVILQMELSGAPLDMVKVKEVEIKLEDQKKIQTDLLMNAGLIQQFELKMRKESWVKKNLLLKVKVKPLSDFDDIVFKPTSNKQLQSLLYDHLGYDIIDTTDTGLPATGSKTLKKLLAVCKLDSHRVILEALVELSEVSIILNNFIASFLHKSIRKNDKRHYLHGNFNLGGTVSGRLSSSKPNMQNIPSTGNKYAKDIKECFVAPTGWLFCGADFDSLEDKISALTTKDPNKLKVYEDGYDGHCLRAYTYFGRQMPDIGNTVQEINSIAQRYPELRQDSKAPTFLLTYGGTYHGLMSNVGLPEIAAKEIETQYHNLYQVSDKWVSDKLEQASIDGYVTVAFGMRVRTPVLAKTLNNKHSTPYQAKAEGRTAGNALGQSYGMLNNRAGIEFQKRVLASKYAMDIKPIMQIHDSLYFLIRDHLGCIEWFNRNLVECMQWQDLPELRHSKVKLSGGVEIYYPNWAVKYALPTNATKQEILTIGKSK